MTLTLLPFFFLVTALLYAIAGFGGGSTYLALLVLTDIPFQIIPIIALICNLAVVSTNLCYFVWKKESFFLRTLPFIITSIPCAYLGGRIVVDKSLFLVLLIFSLLAAGTRLLLTGREIFAPRTLLTKQLWLIGLGIGACLGFLSGIVGIGGGIFLSPLLYFLSWGTPRRIAAHASFFIFVNSLSGLWGQYSKLFPPNMEEISPIFITTLLLAVSFGGYLGNHFRHIHLSLRHLQHVTAMLILVAAGKILWRFI